MSNKLSCSVARVLGAVTLAACSTLAQAGIVSVSGASTVIAAPGSVDYQALESDSQAFVFAEKSNFVLGASTPFDAVAPGKYDTLASLVGGSLAAGTHVSSYYLHADKVGRSDTPVYFIGSISFDTDILGVAASDGGLLGSDFLGAVGTTYPAAPGRRFDLDFADWFEISADRRTLTYSAGLAIWSDDLRIVVSSVPEPSAMALSLLGLGLLGLSRRRANAS